MGFVKVQTYKHKNEIGEFVRQNYAHQIATDKNCDNLKI